MAGTTRGATSLGDGGDRKKRGGWLWWLLAALVALGLILLLLSLLGGDDDDDKSASTGQTTTQQSSQEATGGSGSGSGSGSGGTLTASGESLLPLPADGSAEDLVGEPAEGKGITVQEVNPNEGFWVGSSETDRVYVEFGAGAGEAEEGSEQFTPEVGDKVDLQGEVRPAPAEPEQTLNLRQSADAELVRSQGFFVNATEVGEAS